jgi:hypothetical protein
MDKTDTQQETANSLIVQKVFEYVSRYFVIIAGFLSGTGGLFTAVGFLAERSHLTMLGATFIPVNLDQYLYTGAKFFAVLPILVITTIADSINELGGWVISLIFIFFAWHFLLRIKRIQSAKKKFENIGKEIGHKIKNFTYQYLSGLLFLFMIILFFGVAQMFLAFGITNLLYDKKIPYNEAIFSNTNELQSWVIQKPKITQQLLSKLENEKRISDDSISKLKGMPEDHVFENHKDFKNLLELELGEEKEISLVLESFFQINKDALNKYMGKLFILVSMFGLILWLFVSLVRKHHSIEPNIWQNLWLGISILLFFTQVILLPANYGILLLSNEFPEVIVSLEKEPSNEETNSEKPESEWPGDNRFILLYQESDTFYLYSEAKVWYVSGKDIRSMIYVGKSNVFVFPNTIEL